jgi:outer membrane protein assembly factor BamB
VLTCLELKTGRVKWTNRSVGKASLTCADGNLIVRSEQGPVALVQAVPTGYKELGRFQQPERSDKPSWTYPVVADGKLFLRDQDILLVYALKGR